MKKVSSFISSLLILTNLNSFAVTQSDQKYYEIEGEDYQYIFPKQYEHLIPELDKMNTYLKGIYQKDFNWKLDEETSFVLSSNWNQIANAFATNIPNLNTTFYNGGFDVIDNFATTSWLQTLLVHETSHLYQLNHKDNFSQFVHSIFGNNVFHLLPFPISVDPVSFFPIPYVTNPNFFLPNWMIEGNAVLNESRFGIGGRLYSGEFRALVYAQAAAGRVTPSRLTNIYAEFPYGRNPYLTGGYAYAYLAEKYGVDQSNRLYDVHARHYFNPFLVSGDVEILYGKEYDDLIKDIGRDLSNKAKGQKLAKGKLVTHSKEDVLFTRNGNEIFFLGTENRASFRTLFKFNQKTKKLNMKAMDLKSGRVFIHDNRPAVATSGFVDRNKIRYTLWHEDNVAVSDYLDHLVLDQRNGKTLSFKSDKYFGEGELFVDKKFYTLTNSTALFGPKGEIYYFKQKDKVRSLYRNDKKLASFKGYYGKLADIGKNGEVYFIATTKYGSSLFEYNNGKISRLSSADNIVNAKQISKTDFIASTVTANGYDVRLVGVENKKTEGPYDVKYSFEKEESFKAFSSDKLKTLKLKHVVTDTTDKDDYNSLLDMKMSTWAFTHTDSDRDGRHSSLAINFTDPLSYNFLNLFYMEDEYDGEQFFSFNYMNRKHLLSWGLGAGYERNKDSLDIKRSQDENILTARLNLGYRFMKYKSWNLDGAATITQEFKDDDDVEHYASLSLKKFKSFGNNLLPYRYRNLALEYQQEDLNNRYALSYDHTQGFNDDFFKTQHYLLFSSTLSYAEKGELEIGKRLSLYEHISLTDRISYSNYEQFSARVGSAFKSVVNVNWLSWYFPLGVRRIAIGPKATFTYLDTKFINADYLEYGIALDVEILANHTHPVIGTVDITLEDGERAINSLNFKLTQEF